MRLYLVHCVMTAQHMAPRQQAWRNSHDINEVRKTHKKDYSWATLGQGKKENTENQCLLAKPRLFVISIMRIAYDETVQKPSSSVASNTLAVPDHST